MGLTLLQLVLYFLQSMSYITRLILLCQAWVHPTVPVPPPQYYSSNAQAASRNLGNEYQRLRRFASKEPPWEASMHTPTTWFVSVYDPGRARALDECLQHNLTNRETTP
jgi:hypothetical protein